MYAFVNIGGRKKMATEEKRKLAFISGGSRGIGAAAVKEFVQKGYNVVFIYEKEVEAAKQVIDDAEGKAIGLKCDVRDFEGVKDAQKQGRIYFGASKYDAVICNAGISRVGIFNEMSLDEIREIMDVNFMGVVNVIKATVDEMIEAKEGSIVCTSSMWGLAGASSESIYSSSKAAIIGLVRSLAVEMGPSGIRVNAVAPGVIETDMCKDIDDEIMDRLKNITPLGRTARPEEVAKTIFYLASKDSSFITGQVLGVDGGFIV